MITFYWFSARQRMTNFVPKKTLFFLVLIILAIAIFFRFYKLNQIPPGLYPDVAINGNDALHALKTGEFKVFYPENNGREGLFINLIALSFYLFGISILSIKLVPAIIGSLTVLGLYLLTKELFSLNNNKKYSAEIIALLSTFFLAISFWHVNFSRLGFRAIMVPFILVWSFYLLFRAMILMRKKTGQNENERNSQNNIQVVLYSAYFILAGLVFGLGFHTYIAYRVAPAILGIAFLIELFNYWKKRKLESKNKLHLSLWIILFLAIAIAASPMAIYFYHNPLDFMGRTGQVSVLASKNPIKELSISVVKSLGMFNVWGDCNWRHNLACKPALPLPVGLLFLIGFFITIKEFLMPFLRRLKLRYRENLTSANPSLPETNAFGWSPAQISFFLLVWFGAMLLPEILTSEGLPHSLRAIGAIPPVYILTGLGGWLLYSKIKFLIIKKYSGNDVKTKKWNSGLMAFCIGFLIAILLSAFQQYFIAWGQNQEVKGAFTQRYVDIGKYLNSLPENAKKYVIVNEGGVLVPYQNGIPMPAQTIMFVEQTVPQKQKTFYLVPDELTNFHGLNPKANYSLVFIPITYNEKIFEELKQQAPNGTIKQINNDIWTFEVKN